MFPAEEPDSIRDRCLGLKRIFVVNVLAGAFLISFSSVFVKIADVGPTAAAFYRFLFGFVALAAAAGIARERFWKGQTCFLWAAACGLLFSFDLFFWHRSIHFVGPGVATILANLQVFGLAAVGVAFMGERLTGRLAVAVPMSVFGLFLLVGKDWFSLGAHYQAGVVYGLLTAVCYTGVTLVLRRSQTLDDKLSPTVNMAWVCLVASVASAGEVRLSGESFVIPNVRSFAVLVAYGAVCSGLGWALISRGLPLMPASRAGLALILQPTLAFIWDVLFFGRPTGLVDVVGAGATLTAIYLGTMGAEGEKRQREGPASSEDSDRED